MQRDPSTSLCSARDDYRTIVREEDESPFTDH
jgi:hypothetical protein